MTACVTESGENTAPDGAARCAGFVIAADGSYAARLTLGAEAGANPSEREDGEGDGTGAAWFPERWTLNGPEPYAVPLPLDQPEEPDAKVLPLIDGRVLIHRRVADRQAFSLLYPTGPGTGELPLGAVECPRLTLLPPSPDGTSAYALAPGEHGTTLWLVAGGAFGPEPVATVRGRCTGGVWLDRTGRLLALDRELDGVVKSVAVDLQRGGEVSPLLQITEESNDRLLLADADSGLLLIRSDAPGHDRLGWGVLGSARPVRFPECLRPAECAVTPFAVQPGQVLMPESCAVALRIDGPGGTWVGTWRPSSRQLHQQEAPDGWLAGTGLWSPEGVLQLPYVTGTMPCGVARVETPRDAPRDIPMDTWHPATGDGGPELITEPAQVEVTDENGPASRPTRLVRKPVPLQQAPLTGRTAAG
ncbi:hypothetical protein GCM10011583_31970 [Streptomyces camponoticapitis]|uniref:Uncharacterized protein n=1 Tax=Streptomyces camponoticapitis TaxID=1616125 RepID=A0ABQ2E954_9ACTN|nr:hypothetical protein [Streptomyces camponoticapitis]GGJ98127.1 hypothetical protein GCM10011583_31970 [Streptomyces camponoticapitis]